MRLSATRALLERDDVIIVASVSCLYGIGSVETYSAMIFDLETGKDQDQGEIIRKLVAMQYTRNDVAFARGTFRVRGDNLEIFPSHYEDIAWRISFFGDEVESIVEFDPLTGKAGAKLEKIRVYANSHHVTPGPTMQQAMHAIRFELEERLKELNAEGKLLEAQRLEQRTHFDLEMIAATWATARASRTTAASSRARLPRRAAADAVRLPAGERPAGRRRIPRDHSADRRHVQGRPRAQGNPGGIRLPPAVGAGQPPACASRSGRRWRRRPFPSPRRRAAGRWNRPAVCSPSRWCAPPA